MKKCPLTKQDCTKTACAWFKDGECATTALVTTLDLMLDDITHSIEHLKKQSKILILQCKKGRYIMNLGLFSKEDFIEMYQKDHNQDPTPQLIAVAELASAIYAEGFKDGFKKAKEISPLPNPVRE